ncbi:Hypothetical protein HVR_LOCUS1186 [uncultured virus]|nr:Hypothetical protein HVR_LOCUS1186 [uncultured virus]
MEVDNVTTCGGSASENVMSGDRITMATNSLGVLFDFASRHSIPYATLRSDKFLTKLQQFKNDPSFNRRFARTLADIHQRSNYIDDAIFAISGDLQGKSFYRRPYKPFEELGNPYGHSLANYGAIEMNTLISLAYYIVTHSVELGLGTGNIQEILLTALIKNTGDCVEEDGHLVCNWGKTQRILNTFQGYIPHIQITASLLVESTDEFQTRVTAVIRDYLITLENDNPLKLIVCGEPIPSIVDRDDVKMAYRRIVEGWKDHASLLYRGRQLDGVNRYLDNLLNSYIQMVDDAGSEIVVGCQQASFILDVNTAMPNGGKCNSRVDRETAWQEKLGNFKDELNSTQSYIREFLRQANDKISTLSREHQAKENEMNRIFMSENEQKIDASLRVLVRIQESLNFFSEARDIWTNLDALFSQVDEPTAVLYNNQPKINANRAVIPVKASIDAAIDFTMAVKLDYNEVYISCSQDYASRSAKVEQLIKKFELGEENNGNKNKQIEYDNLIRVAIRAQEQVDLSLAILRPIERVLDLLKHVKSKLMLIFPQQW